LKTAAIDTVVAAFFSGLFPVVNAEAQAICSAVDSAAGSTADSVVADVHVLTENGDSVVQVGEDSFDCRFAFGDDFVGAIEFEESDAAQPRGDMNVGRFPGQT